MCFLLAISYDHLCLINCCINRHHESINNTYTLVFVHVYIALLYTLTLSRGFFSHTFMHNMVSASPPSEFFPQYLICEIYHTTYDSIKSILFHLFIFFYLFFLPNSEKINLL